MPNLNSNETTAKVEVDCISSGADHLQRQTREVVKETPLTIEIQDVGTYTLMCTPVAQMELAVGFAFTEGLIRKKDDINMLLRCPDDPRVIRMQITDPSKAGDKKRSLLIISSCGICGSEDIDKVIHHLPQSDDRLRISRQDLTAMTDSLKQRQDIFQRTGGTHAIALVKKGEIVALGEDVGRHNAFDKAVGSCILNQIPTSGSSAVLSGRVSFEMVAKAARAGVELIAAVSAPTTLALDTARHCHITLCGFVRGDQATIYCHSQRIL